MKENLNVAEVFKYLAELNDKRSKDGTMGQAPQAKGFAKPSVQVREIDGA